jgi:RNA polymerase sigma-32 factor
MWRALVSGSSKISPGVARLIDASRRQPTLSRREEAQLHRRWKKKGDFKARDSLANANLRHVISTALTFRHYPVDLDDLVAEGFLGLLVAIDKFEPARGYRLVTYAAYWIRAYIITFIMKSWVKGKTRMSAVRSRMFFKLRRDRARVGAQFGSEGSMRRLARESNMTEDRLGEVLSQLDSPDFPLEVSNENLEWNFFRDRLESQTPSPEETSSSVERESSIRRAIHQALGNLDKREKFIIEHRMMDDEPESLASLGRRMGISRERTRQLEMRARRKIMRSLRDAGVTHARAREMLS